MTMPLTGAQASFGEQIRPAVNAWVKRVNAAGGILGRQVQVTIADDTGDPATAVVLYSKMLDTDKVDFILGTYNTTIVEQVSTLAERRQMLFLAGLAPGRAIYERGYQFLFQALPSTSDDAMIGTQAFLDSLPADLQPKSMALTSADHVGAIGTLTGAKQYLTKVKSVFEDHYPLTATDLTPLVQRVKAAGADLVVHSGLAVDTITFAQAMVNSGYKPKITLYDSQGIQLAKLGSATAAQGIVYFTWFDPGLKIDGVSQFVADYKAEAAGADPLSWSAGTYAALQVLQKAITTTKSTNQTQLRDYVRANSFATVVGDLSFDARGVNKDQHTILVQWQDGKPVVIWPKTVAAGSFIAPPK
jgi:branched-chain amino acid transport system substrate-binding protein